MVEEKSQLVSQELCPHSRKSGNTYQYNMSGKSLFVKRNTRNYEEEDISRGNISGYLYPLFRIGRASHFWRLHPQAHRVGVKEALANYFSDIIMDI